VGVGVLAGAWLLADELASGEAEPEDRARQGLLLGAAGGVVGGLSGAVLHPARWQPVSIDAMRPRPPSAAGASLSLRF
jgi:hypothetical protein